MTSERWRKIEELYCQAREHGHGVLADTDPELRREVERLLANGSDETAPIPATEFGMSGQTFGHYRILEMLGAGGMGVVYKAFDLKLGRVVALKFLPPQLRHSEELKRRLTDEARAASALDHPNIVVIYAIEEAPGGGLFIAMAFHEGGTLRDRIREPLPVTEALSIARQIASGLARAHEHGVLHRDIKPANVVLAKDGVARIIDFGLAKSSDTTATLDGSAKGTPLYMSPEQASGKPVDFRTDLWSLGAVLYEMFAGKPPFAGGSQLQVMRAVLQDEPVALSRLRPELPRDAEAIVVRALKKDPAERYQSAEEMVRDLSAAMGLETTASAYIITQAAPSRSRKLQAAGALAILACAALGWFLFGRARGPVTSPNEYVQLTNFTDSATSPALSPDGRMVTFFRGGKAFLGEGQIYAKLLPDGESKQLTFDSNQKYDAVFSADGTRVAYTDLDLVGASWNTWTVPVLGGPPALFMKNSAGLSWIGPDQVLFSEIMAGSVIHMGVVTAKESRAEQRPIYFPAHERAMAHYSWLSPDRTSVLIVEMNASTEWQRCRVVPVEGSSAGVQVGPEGACTAAAWSPDGRWIYLNVKVGGSAHIWRQGWTKGAPQGNSEQITFGPGEEDGVAVAPDGKSLITSVGVLRSSLWMHDSTGDHAVSLEGSAEAPRLSPDGKRVYYLLRKSTSSDVNELWRRDLATGKTDSVITGQRISDYDVSGDEARVAFTVNAGRESQIFVAATDRSSPPRLVVRGGDLVSFAGGELTFRQVGGKSNYHARISAEGTGLRRLREREVVEIGGISPDGEWATESAGGLPLVGTIAISAKRDVQLRICAVACYAQWSADGKYMYVAVISRASAAGSTVHTYAIPIPNGIEHFKWPEAGIDRATPAELAGLKFIPQGLIAPGPDPHTYAYATSSFLGNLFRIPLH